MTDTERLDWLARMMDAITGDDAQRAEAADAAGERFNSVFNAARKAGKPAEKAMREAIDGSQLGL